MPISFVKEYTLLDMENDVFPQPVATPAFLPTNWGPLDRVYLAVFYTLLCTPMPEVSPYDDMVRSVPTSTLYGMLDDARRHGAQCAAIDSLWDSLGVDMPYVRAYQTMDVLQMLMKRWPDWAPGYDEPLISETPEWWAENIGEPSIQHAVMKAEWESDY